jgi:O-antigen/teichoic acid export membrane protein
MTTSRIAVNDVPNLGDLRGRVVRGSGWVFAGKVVTSILGLAASATLARLMAQSDLGVYFIAFSTAMFASTIADFGLDRVVVRYVSASLSTDRPARARAAIRGVFTIVGAATAASALVLAIVLRPALEHQFGSASATPAVIALIVAWASALAFQTLTAETFRGFHDFRLATLADGLITNVFAITVLGFFWWAGLRISLAGALAVVCAATAGALCISAGLLRRRVSTLPRSSHVPRSELVSVGWPLSIVSAATFLLGTGVDIWIVGAFDGSADAALYGAAVRLVLFVATPLIIVTQVLPPIVAQLHAQGRPRQLERVLRDVATVAGVPATAVLLLFLVVGGPILSFVYGPHFADAAVVLAILSVGRLFGVYAGSCGIALMMTGHQRTMMAITVISGVLSVGLGLLFGWFFGMVGVAVGTATGQIVQNLGQLFSARRGLGIWTHARLSLRPLVRFISSPAQD